MQQEEPHGRSITTVKTEDSAVSRRVPLVLGHVVRWRHHVWKGGPSWTRCAVQLPRSFAVCDQLRGRRICSRLFRLLAYTKSILRPRYSVLNIMYLPAYSSVFSVLCSCIRPCCIMEQSTSSSSWSETDSLYSFKHKLKTHLFSLYFDEWLSVFIFLQTFVMHSRFGVE